MLTLKHPILQPVRRAAVYTIKLAGVRLEQLPLLLDSLTLPSNPALLGNSSM